MWMHQLLLNLLRCLLTQKVDHCPQSQRLREMPFSFWHFSFASVENFQNYLCSALREVRRTGVGRQLGDGGDFAYMILGSPGLMLQWGLTWRGRQKASFLNEEKYRYSKCVSHWLQSPLPFLWNYTPPHSPLAAVVTWSWLHQATQPQHPLDYSRMDQSSHLDLSRILFLLEISSWIQLGKPEFVWMYSIVGGC